MKKKKGDEAMNMPLAEIERHLKTLRLNGMIATLDTRIIQANQDASFTEVFACPDHPGQSGRFFHRGLCLHGTGRIGLPKIPPH